MSVKMFEISLQLVISFLMVNLFSQLHLIMNRSVASNMYNTQGISESCYIREPNSAEKCCPPR